MRLELVGGGPLDLVDGSGPLDLVGTYPRTPSLWAKAHLGRIGFPSPPDGTSDVDAVDKWTFLGLYQLATVTGVRRRRITAGSAHQKTRFFLELIDAFSGDYVRLLFAKAGGQLTIKTGATIARTLTGIVLPPDESDVFDPDAYFLRPVALVDGARYELGVFTPSTDTLHHLANGRWRDVQWHDLAAFLLDTTSTAYGAPVGTAVTDAMLEVLVLAGLSDLTIGTSSATLAAPLAWPPGTPYVTILKALCVLAGFAFPWIDRHGVTHLEALPYIGATLPRRTYEPGEASVITPPSETTDRWGKTTTWWVTSKSEEAVVGGTYTLPASHPLRRRRGQKVETIEIPGLATTGECRDRARDLAQRDPDVHARRTFTARFDPTLEPYDVIGQDQRDWLLDGAVAELVPAVDQAITIRESINDEVAA